MRPTANTEATVALRKESVDRNNNTTHRKKINPAVALRKESVDRNDVRDPATALPSVALRKESVDRNSNEEVSYSIIIKSLSARRAWIEMREKFVLSLPM